ncbi:MAG: hypothetical protein JW822_14265 [Spirochaetales bacterium]|nr:hypothetical protein [Spirochaetales bacterium]
MKKIQFMAYLLLTITISTLLTCAIPGGTDAQKIYSTNIIEDDIQNRLTYTSFDTKFRLTAIEVGSVHVSQLSKNQWHTISLNYYFDNPVVVMGPVSSNDALYSFLHAPSPCIVRVRNINSNTFEFQIDEWDYLDGTHEEEVISYLVAEQGSYTVNGMRVDALKISNVNHEWTNISFDQSFGSTPIVIAQCTSFNGGSAVTTRIKDITTNGFSIKLQEEENNDGIHAQEDVCYIAFESEVSIEDKVYTANIMMDENIEVLRITHFTETPCLFAGIQTYNGGDPCALRYSMLLKYASGIQMKIEEEQSLDKELNHCDENVGYLLIKQGSVCRSIAPFDDARWEDLSDQELGYDLIKTLWYNISTVFSQAGQIYADEIMEKAKNPGLGVRALHQQGITGRDINIAIIDQNLAQDLAHPEFIGKIIEYYDTGCEVSAGEGTMHGPCVVSLAVGNTIGTAPGASVYYIAVPVEKADAAYYAIALDWIIDKNKILPDDEKIRIVSVSAAPSVSDIWDNSHLWVEAVARAENNNILVIDCEYRTITRRGYYDLGNPDLFELFTFGTPKYPDNAYDPTTVFIPVSLRTMAEQYHNGEFSFVFTGVGGLSWTCPYVAGVLALGWQVNPDLTKEEILDYLFASAYIHTPTGNKIINPPAFIQMIRDNM